MKLTTTAKLAQIRVGLRSGEDVWISPHDGLNLIYGKNGSGKSTVLGSLCKLFLHPNEGKDSEKSIKDSNFLILATAYFEIDSVVVIEIYDSLLSAFQEHLTNEDINEPSFKKDFQSRTSSIADEISSGITNPRIDFGDSDESNVVDLNLYLEEFDKFFESIEGSELAEDILPIIRERLQEEGVKIFLDTADSQHLFDSLRDGIRESYSEIYSDLSVEQANERLEYFALETRLEQNALSDRSFSGAMWSELLKLYLVTLVCDYYSVLKVPASIWDEEKSVEPSTKLVQAAPSLFGIAQTVLRAFENQLDCPTFWIEPSSHKNLKFGHVGLALGRTGVNEVLDGAVQNFDAQTAAALDAYVSLHKALRGEIETTDNLEALYYFVVAGNVVTSGFDRYIFDRHARFEDCSSNDKYLQLDRAGAFMIVSTPIRAVLLDRQIDLDHVAKRTFASLIDGELKVAFAVVDFETISEIEFAGDGTKYIEDFVSLVSKFLARLDIGISRCEFKYSNDLRDWASGESAEFLFFTGQSDDRDIRMADLSSGQQYWVSAAFQICYAEQAGIRYLIIADEPERGLHQRAVLSAFDSLRGLSATSVIATHSVSALGIAGAHLLHLEKGDDGKIRLTEPYLGDDVAEAARRFGTTPFDLFSIKRALVVVEGAHDVEVVRGLAGLSFGGKLLDRLIIIPARGVKNVATIADSVVVTEFTNLHILAIVDNGRAEMLNGVIERASAALQEGKSERQAIVVSGIPEYSKDASPEERFMFDLIERSIHRRIVNRLHLFALSVPDIVDLLPEKSFNLQNSWSELRAAYKRSGNREGFKIWIKSEYGVSISSKTVKKSFDGLDKVDGDLKRILDELEIVASLSPFED